MSKVEIYHNKPLPIDLIKDTFEASFNILFDKEYWQWRFLNNPNSKKTYISYIVENGVLAAYYAVSPMIIIIDGKEEKVALSNMTMTHPDFRRRGYFKKLAQNLFDNLKAEGFIGVFGFANHNSHYGFRKYLNWQDLSSLNLFQVKASDFRNIKIKENNITFKIEKITDKILENIPNLQSTDEKTIHLKRDNFNIKWRLKNNPSNSYKVQVGKKNNKIVSLLFFKEFKDEIDVMEIFYNNDINNAVLLSNCMSNLISTTNATINLWSNLHSDEHINLEKQGFQETGFNTYFGVIPFTENKTILDYKNWHYRFIDSDIF